LRENVVHLTTGQCGTTRPFLELLMSEVLLEVETEKEDKRRSAERRGRVMVPLTKLSLISSSPLYLCSNGCLILD
jgi:hypothetical protein